MERSPQKVCMDTNFNEWRIRILMNGIIDLHKAVTLDKNVIQTKLNQTKCIDSEIVFPSSAFINV